MLRSCSDRAQIVCHDLSLPMECTRPVRTVPALIALEGTAVGEVASERDRPPPPLEGLWPTPPPSTTHRPHAVQTPSTHRPHAVHTPSTHALIARHATSTSATPTLPRARGVATRVACLHVPSPHSPQRPPRRRPSRSPRPQFPPRPLAHP